jgi:hypothetical protein
MTIPLGEYILLLKGLEAYYEILVDGEGSHCQRKKAGQERQIRKLANLHQFPVFTPFGPDAR